MKAVDGHLYDVIFIGTDQGNIFKMVNLAGTKATTRQPSYHIYTFQITNVSSKLKICKDINDMYSMKNKNNIIVELKNFW